MLELREAPGTTSPLRVELWDWDMVGKNDFLGMVSVPPTNKRPLWLPTVSNKRADKMGAEGGCSAASRTMASLGSSLTVHGLAKGCSDLPKAMVRA